MYLKVVGTFDLRWDSISLGLKRKTQIVGRKGRVRLGLSDYYWMQINDLEGVHIGTHQTSGLR